MIGIGSDHGGYELKQEIIKHLEDRNLEYKDFGSNSSSKSYDYPLSARKVSQAILDGECEKGISRFIIIKNEREVFVWKLKQPKQ